MVFAKPEVSRRLVLGGLASSASLPLWAKTIPANPDVVIIGAGSAGLAAAHQLLELGRSVVVVEGAERIGGRAFTDTQSFDLPFDHGCSWVQGPRDLPYVKMARDWGFELMDHSGAGDALFVGNRRATSAETRASNKAWSQLELALGKAGRNEQDVAASTVFPNELAFSGTTQTWTGPMDFGVDFEDLSVLDYWNFEDVEADFLIREGYGTLVSRMGQGLPVQLNTPATAVDWSGDGVTVHTPSGQIRAKACIVTVSTGVLNAGAIKFTPKLPVWKEEAISHLSMGLLAKIPLQLDGEKFGLSANEWLTYHVPNEMPAEACFFLTWPFESNMMIGFVGGSFGWQLSGEGPGVAVDFALQQLVNMLGSDVRKHFVKGDITRWADNPWTLGAYAAAMPGHFSAREGLARPVADRVYFAGEAVAMPYHQLCGGAYLSGVSVAKDVARVI